jgi:hypothetical protein
VRAAIRSLLCRVVAVAEGSSTFSCFLGSTDLDLGLCFTGAAAVLVFKETLYISIAIKSIRKISRLEENEGVPSELYSKNLSLYVP